MVMDLFVQSWSQVKIKIGKLYQSDPSSSPLSLLLVTFDRKLTLDEASSLPVILLLATTTIRIKPCGSKANGCSFVTDLTYYLVCHYYDWFCSFQGVAIAHSLF